MPVIHLQVDAVGAFDDRLDDAINDSTRRQQAGNDAVADFELPVIGLFVGWHARESTPEAPLTQGGIAIASGPFERSDTHTPLRHPWQAKAIRNQKPETR